MEEIWKEVPYTNGTYEVSDQLRVRKGETILKTNARGAVGIYIKNRHTTRTVTTLHRLAFAEKKLDEYFLTIPSFPNYKISNYKTVMTTDGKIRTPQNVRGNIYVYVDKKPRNIDTLYKQAFMYGGEAEYIKTITEIKKKIKPVAPRDFMPNHVHNKNQEFRSFKAANSERYL